MRAVVTGSAGFIGRHFCRHLRSIGWSVLEVDIRNEPSIDCRSFFHKSRMHFDLALHCAAVIPDLEERGRNPMPVAGNLEIDAAFFQWMMRTKPTQTVYFSSAAAYPIDLNLRTRGLHEDDIDLDDLRHPDGMYGMVKLVGEIQAREAQRLNQHVLVVRPQTGYGEDQSPSYPFRAIIERARNGDDPLVVWGPGDQARDFIHVDDIVSAVMKLLAVDAEGPINLGSGAATTLSEFARMVCASVRAEVEDYSPSIAFDLTKPQGAKWRFADTTLMHLFHDHRVSLTEGIGRALDA